MSKVANRDWAEDEDEDPLALPALEIKKNPDGTETQISYRWRDDGKKVKTTRVVKRSVVKRAVSPGIAERRAWPKFGMAAKDAPGPNPSTTSVGEDIVLVLRQGFKSSDNQGPGDAMSELDKKKQELKNTTVKCRICSGEHFTARCPFKGTMAPEGEPPAGEPAADPMAEVTGGGATGKSYVPPALRKGGGGVGEKMAGGGKYERDDLATLRVTNVSEWAEEGELRDIFERHGRVTRVFLAKDRETGRAKGFAFVSFADRDSAASACAKVDGHGYNNLILRVEFAKKTT